MRPGPLAVAGRTPVARRQLVDGNGLPESVALSIRRKLRDRRPVTVRRHGARLATRMLALLAGDIAALMVYQAIASISASTGTLERYFPGYQANLPGPAAGLDFAAALLLALFATGSYSRHRMTNGPVRLLTAAALGGGLALTYWLIIGSATGAAAIALYSATVLLTWIVLLVERPLAEAFLRDVWPRDRGTIPALFITSRSAAEERLENAVLAHGGDYRKVGYVAPVGSANGSELGSLSDLPQVIYEHDVETVIVCSELSDQGLHEILERSLLAGCHVLYPARAMRLGEVRPRLVWHQDQPFFELGAPVLKAWAVIAKRIMDIVGSLICLTVLPPILILIAIAIKLDSRGPVFFVQSRAGLGGHRFRMLKFRTMKVGADDEKGSLAHLNRTGDPRLFKIPQDPRVTRLGEFLRRWSLDELPQIFNVLAGSMSLVGPRPFFESDFENYHDHHFRRLDAKPGITGLWQVSGRSDVVDFDDVVFLDRQYIEQWSIRLDISILFRTIPAVLRAKGAC